MKKVTTIATATLLALMLSTQLYAEKQPRMHEALKHLQAAKAQLKKGSHDKGGHRAKALDLVNRAIKQVRKGIKFDNRN